MRLDKSATGARRSHEAASLRCVRHLSNSSSASIIGARCLAATWLLSAWKLPKARPQSGHARAPSSQAACGGGVGEGVGGGVGGGEMHRRGFVRAEKSIGEMIQLHSRAPAQRSSCTCSG